MLDRLPEDVVRVVFQSLAASVVAQRYRTGEQKQRDDQSLTNLAAISKQLREIGLEAAYSGFRLYDLYYFSEKLGKTRFDLLLDTLDKGAGRFVKNLEFAFNPNAHVSPAGQAADVQKFTRLFEICTNIRNLTLGPCPIEIARLIGQLPLKRLDLQQSVQASLGRESSSSYTITSQQTAVDHILAAQAPMLEFYRHATKICPSKELPIFYRLRTLTAEIFESDENLRLIRQICPSINRETIHTLSLLRVTTARLVELALEHIGPSLSHLHLRSPLFLTAGTVSSYSEIAKLLTRCVQLRDVIIECPWFGNAHLQALRGVEKLRLVNPVALEEGYLLKLLRQQKEWLPKLRELEIEWVPLGKAEELKARKTIDSVGNMCESRGVYFKPIINGEYLSDSEDDIV